MSGDESVRGTGRTLEAALRTAPMTVGDAVRTASAVADQVAALHAMGRAHGDVGPSTVAIGADGSAALVGTAAPRTGLAAPPALRSGDLHGVAWVLATALGWPDAEGLPAPVVDLVRRAEASDAPAAALATALRRLEREPLAVIALLPPAAPVPARREQRFGGGLVQLIPRADRRTTGTAAIVVAGAAAVGAMLLLIGTPASTGRGPAAAAEARTSQVDAADSGGPAAVVADAAPTTVQDVLRPTVHRARPAPAATARPAERTVVPSAEIAAPAAVPTTVLPAPTTAPTAAPTTPSPTATSAPTEEPTEAPTAAPDPTAEPTRDPTPPATAPEPSEPAQPSAEPTVPAPDPTPAATTAG